MRTVQKRVQKLHPEPWRHTAKIAAVGAFASLAGGMVSALSSEADTKVVVMAIAAATAILAATIRVVVSHRLDRYHRDPGGNHHHAGPLAF